MMFAVCVTFEINPDALEDFMPLMLANAARSLEVEPGCHRFDVCTDPERANEVFLYELYTDRAAFDAHLGSDHFKAFDEQVSAMLTNKTVRTYAQVAS